MAVRNMASASDSYCPWYSANNGGRSERPRPRPDGIEEPTAGAARVSALDIAAIAAPVVAQAAGPTLNGAQGPRQHAFRDAVAVFARQVIAQHHGLPARGLRKKAIKVQRRRQSFQLLLEGRMAAQGPWASSCNVET